MVFTKYDQAVLEKIFLNGGRHCQTDSDRQTDGRQIIIMKTCPCNEHPLTPHFYIVKLGFTGVYIIFLFLLKNIDCGYSLEPPH